jgi:phosphatidate cytidylyltransferase
MAFPGAKAVQACGVAGGALVAFAMANATPEPQAISAAAATFSGALLAVVAVGLMLALFFAEDPATGVARVGHSVLGVLYAGAFLPHFIWLRWGPAGNGAAWVLFVLAVGMLGDSAGYFAGRRFGRRLLMPAVSPKKTVEGAVGALGGNVVAGAVVKMLLLPGVGWGEILCISLIAGILAQTGDLCESLLKRAFGAKDSGHFFPGHGGILDRADSLVFPTVFVYYYVSFLHGHG